MCIELRKFSIKKLYGYKDIHLIFNKKVQLSLQRMVLAKLR